MKILPVGPTLVLLLLTSACVPGGPPAPATAAAPSAGEVRVRPGDAAEMVLVPAGRFTMGSTLEMSRAAKKLCEATKGDSARAACRAEVFNNERPPHLVTLSAFWIDRTEVTNHQYLRCVRAGACDAPLLKGSFSRTVYYGEPGFDDFPVLNVRWEMAADFCAWAGARLPTEAQWEYAARGPESRLYPWGNDFEGLKLNYCDANCPLLEDPSRDDGYADTSPVGHFASGASWVGAMDMAGNAREWVADWLGPYAADEAVDPAGPANGEYKVVRGGSWYDTPDDVRSTNRGGELVDYWRDNLGFRCAQ